MTEPAPWPPDAVTRCGECDPEGFDTGQYDWWRCIKGYVYGPCESDLCGGVCSDKGPCPCTCHQRVSRV